MNPTAGTFTVVNDAGVEVTLPYNATAKQIHEAGTTSTVIPYRRPQVMKDPEIILTTALLGIRPDPDARVLAQHITKELHRMGYTIEIRHCESHA